MDFSEMQFDPMCAGAGLLGGILSLVVMSQVDIGLFYKVAAFAGTTIVCYFMFGKIMSRQ